MALEWEYAKGSQSRRGPRFMCTTPDCTGSWFAGYKVLTGQMTCNYCHAICTTHKPVIPVYENGYENGPASKGGGGGKTGKGKGKSSTGKGGVGAGKAGGKNAKGKGKGKVDEGKGEATLQSPGNSWHDEQRTAKMLKSLIDRGMPTDEVKEFCKENDIQYSEPKPAISTDNDGELCKALKAALESRKITAKHLDDQRTSINTYMNHLAKAETKYNELQNALVLLDESIAEYRMKIGKGDAGATATLHQDAIHVETMLESKKHDLVAITKDLGLPAEKASVLENMLSDITGHVLWFASKAVKKPDVDEDMDGAWPDSVADDHFQTPTEIEEAAKSSSSASKSTEGPPKRTLEDNSDKEIVENAAKCRMRLAALVGTQATAKTPTVNNDLDL